MTTFEVVLLAWDLGLTVVAVLLALRARELERGRAAHWLEISMLKEAPGVPARAGELAVIQEWRAEMEAAPEGSPRRLAFERRLRDMGEL